MFPNDEEIIRLFKIEECKDSSFKQLVIKYQKKVYWLIRHIIIDHDDTNDLTQEVFIKVWKGLNEFRGDSQLYSWIYRIAVNESLTFIKKNKARNLISLEFASKELNSKIATDTDIQSDQIINKLVKSVAKLPEKQRLVFTLRYYQELTYEEISNILGTSVGGLKASYHHAVKKIEEYIFQPD